MKGLKTMVDNLANKINQPHYLMQELKKVFYAGVRSVEAKDYWYMNFLQGKWISVKDELPDTKKVGDKVLLFRETNEGQKGLKISVHDTRMVKYCEQTSFWQPLPNPPKQ